MIDSKQDITLTDSAAEHIRSELNKNNNGTSLGLKLGIKLTGCSGYAYVLDFIDLNNLECKNYHHFRSKNIDIVVDEESFKLIAGTEVDYVQKGISKMMVFNNPMATAECGCGESFTIDKDKN